MGCICGPACVKWVWLYYKSPDDHAQVCEHPMRKELNGKSFPTIEGEYCDCGALSLREYTGKLETRYLELRRRTEEK